MKRAVVADATLRMCDNTVCTLGFKEKIEIVKQLDRLSVDVIETSLLLNGKSDILFLLQLVTDRNGRFSNVDNLQLPGC